MAIKWTKQDVIQKFQEAMVPTQTPGASVGPDQGQATLQKILQLKQGQLPASRKALPAGGQNGQQ